MKTTFSASTLAVAALLAACGGGGGGGSSRDITLSGTAATGAALPGATVSVKCASGTASATTNADGTYRVGLSATLPCVLRADGGGVTLHGVQPEASGSTFVVNLSPLTELVVAHVGGQAPRDYFDGFGSGSSLTATRVTAAIDYLRAALASTSVDLSGINPLSDPLVAAVGGNPGNALDDRIEELVDTLGDVDLTLAEVAAGIAANPTTPEAVATPLARSATACAWLKSGTYRAMDTVTPDYLVTIDAVALTATSSLGTANLTHVSRCEFAHSAGGTTNVYLASKGGAITVHTTPSGGGSPYITSLFPEQPSLTTADFAGTWNAVTFDDPDGMGRRASVLQLQVAASGSIDLVRECRGLTCVDDTGPPGASIVANSTSGAFDLVEGGVTIGRLIAFRSLTGTMAFLFSTPDEFSVGARQQPVALDPVGTSTSFRSYQTGGDLTTTALTASDTLTVTAVDAAAGTFTRTRTSDSRVDTLSINQPLPGLRHRAADACSVACSAFNSLRIADHGVTLTTSTGTSPASSFFQVAIEEPPM